MQSIADCDRRVYYRLLEYLSQFPFFVHCLSANCPNAPNKVRYLQDLFRHWRSVAKSMRFSVLLQYITPHRKVLYVVLGLLLILADFAEQLSA